MSVGDEDKTTDPVPVEVVVPVPPLVTGNAVPDNPKVNVPDEVNGDPVIVMKLGTPTVIEAIGDGSGTYSNEVPAGLTLSKYVGGPRAVRPVPPLVNGNAEPDNPIARVPDEVIGDPLIDKNAGTVAATDET